TPTIARTFTDPRVKYIRNEQNLGHIRNYNKGITASRGRYVWLISADDRLRSRHILRRYVEAMDLNPKIGYIFCPAVKLSNGVEGNVFSSHSYGSADRVFNGRDFIRTLLYK